MTVSPVASAEKIQTALTNLGTPDGFIAYDIVPLFFPGSEMSLEPFFRFEYVDTQNDVPSGFSANRAFKQRMYIPGLQFKPIPNVVVKLDYRKVDDFAQSSRDEVSLGFGLIF